LFGGDSVAKYYANTTIYHNFHQYEPGDLLPVEVFGEELLKKLAEQEVNGHDGPKPMVKVVEDETNPKETPRKKKGDK
jgi:hypothetical protein